MKNLCRMRTVYFRIQEQIRCSSPDYYTWEPKTTRYTEWRVRAQETTAVGCGTGRAKAVRDYLRNGYYVRIPKPLAGLS